MVWGESRAAEQCVDAGAPDTRNVLDADPAGPSLALRPGTNDARQLACQRQSPDKEGRFRLTMIDESSPARPAAHSHRALRLRLRTFQGLVRAASSLSARPRGCTEAQSFPLPAWPVWCAPGRPPQASRSKRASVCTLSYTAS
jgi:hypothetical protein